MNTLVLFCPPEVDRVAAARVCRASGAGAVATAECASLAEVKSAVRTLAADSKRAVFALRTEKGRSVVPMEEILYCYAVGHKFRVHLRGGEELENITTRSPFLENISPLMESGQFLQCSRGCVVSQKDVARAEQGKLTLTDGSVLKISRRMNRAVWAALGAVWC